MIYNRGGVFRNSQRQSYAIQRHSPSKAVYQAACPPSIRRSAPVMKLLASLIKNTAAPRYSCGALSLPSIFCVGQSRFRSGYCSNRASTMAVTMYPGEMVLTRMPWGPHSDARLRPSWMMPALEALYAEQMRPCEH